MRESLTVLAIALIIVLTTALVGPYFVDWNAHRAAIETRLSSLLGARVTVSGPIDVKLLPRPIFRLGEVTVASASPRAPAAAASRLDVELALTALLRGEFVFVDADLTAPRITLVRGDDGSIVLPHFAATDPDHVSLSHVTLRQGSVLVVDEGGEPLLTVNGLEGDGEAESLVGPFRFAGQADSSRGAVGFRLNTGAVDGDKVRLKATVDAVGNLPRADLEGVVLLPSGSNGGSQPHFEGSVAAASAVPVAGTEAVIPWTLGGRLHAEEGRVDVTGLELRAGTDGRALVMGGDGRIDLGAKPRAAFKLRARQADLPRFAAIPNAGDQPADAVTANSATMLAAMRSLALDPDLVASLPLPVSLDLGVDAVTLGQLTLSGLAARVVVSPRTPLVGSLSLDAPDGSHVALDGSFETGPAAVFKGRLEANTHDLGRLAGSLATDLPDLAAALRGALPARRVALAGAIDLSAIGFAAHDADITLDGSRFGGTITLTRAVGTDRARLFADLTSDALDLDALPDWRDAAVTVARLDLSISLAARAVRLAQSDTGVVDTGRMTLQLSKLGKTVTLDRLSLADIGGATADLTGHSDGTTAHVEGRLDTRRLRDFLALIKRLAPGSAADLLSVRADALSPALLTLAADASLDEAAHADLTRLSVDGTLAGTSVVLRLAPSGEAPAGFKAAATLEAPEAGALLRQFGIATASSTAVGRSRLNIGARLDERFRPLDADIDATVPDAMLAFHGRRAGTNDFSGEMTASGKDVAPLLRAMMLASPEAATPWPVDAKASVAIGPSHVSVANLTGHLLGANVEGTLDYAVPRADTAATALTDATATIPPALTGALTVDRMAVATLAGLAFGPVAAPRGGALWSDAPFGPVIASLPSTDVSLQVASMPLTPTLTASKVKLDLRAASGLVVVGGLSGRVGDGRIGGTFELRRNAKAASLGGHAEWNGLPSSSPSFGGLSRGMLDFAGTGGSVAALVASLGGSGTIGIDQARLPRLDPAALTRAVSDKGETAATIDADAIRQTVTADLDKGALSIGALTTPATLAAGVLRGDPIVVSSDIVRSTSVASLDLRSLNMSLSTTMALTTVPRGWVGSPPKVTATWSGPFTAPAREIDATALVNGIAARAIARDQARIEDFQDDIRERGFFARRLRSIEAEQQAARDKALADQDAQLQKLLQTLPTAPAPTPTAIAPRAARSGTGARAPLDASQKLAP